MQNSLQIMLRNIMKQLNATYFFAFDICVATKLISSNYNDLFKNNIVICIIYQFARKVAMILIAILCLHIYFWNIVFVQCNINTGKK